MRLSKRIFATLTVLFAVILDSSVIPFEAANPVYFPKITLLVIITIALLMGRTQGILYGMIGGVFMDITLMIPTGMTSLLYIIAGFTAGYIGRKMRIRILSSIVSPITAMLIYEVVMLVYYASVGADIRSAMLWQALVRTLIGCAAIQLLYIVFNAVLKPKYSRYARR